MSAPVQLPPVFRDTAPSDFKPLARPWHVEDPELPRHWPHTGAGQGILVGVCDTGVDAGHVELEGRVAGARSFVGGSEYDGNGHGTHVATTIAGAGVGMAPNCRVACAKVLDDSGAGDSETVAQGIDWLVGIGCHVINLSLGGPSDDPYTRVAVQRAIDAGVLVFAATGNERANRVGYPARHCVGVGAVDRKLQLAYFSNRGKDVDVVGFGVEILAGLPGNKYAAWSGTSMATPWIAGVAANRLSAELKHLGAIRTRCPADMLRLAEYTRDLGPEGQDPSYGRGIPLVSTLFYEQLAPPAPVTPPPAKEAIIVGRFEEIGGQGRVWSGNLHLTKGEADA